VAKDDPRPLDHGQFQGNLVRQNSGRPRELSGSTFATPDRVKLLELELDRIDLVGVMQRIQHACQHRLPLQIATVSVHFFSLARRDHGFRDAINRSDISVVDGRLLLWATWLAACPAPEQITGHDIFRESIALAHAHRFKVYLLGGQYGVADELACLLQKNLPGLQVGSDSGGRFSVKGQNEHNDDLVERIRSFDPHLIFVALGAPKQDLWIANNLSRLSGCVAVGVGGVFDTQTGSLPRAPRWMQVAGFESAFQLLVAPRRYGRRYLIEDPPTLGRILALALRRRLRLCRIAKMVISPTMKGDC